MEPWRRIWTMTMVTSIAFGPEVESEEEDEREEEEREEAEEEETR